MNVDINVIAAKIVLTVLMTSVMSVNVAIVKTMNSNEARHWANLRKQFPHSWTTSELGFAIFVGAMLGIALGMIFGIPFCIR